MILAHLPWIMTLMAVMAQRRAFRTRCLCCAAIALLTASQLLLGHPQTTWFCLFTEVLFAVFLLIHDRPDPAFWLWLFMAYALALFLGAVQLLPTYDFLLNSTRASADLRFKTSSSMSISGVVGIAVPQSIIYFGAIPLALVPWWITAHRVRLAAKTDSTARWTAARRLSLFAAILGGLSMWLAFGSNGKLYYLQTLVPLIGSFRAPNRYFILTQFAATMIAAVAFARLVVFLRRGEKLPWKHLAIPWLGVGASAAIAVWFAYFCSSQDLPRLDAGFYGAPLMLAAAVVALTAASRGRRFGLFLLVAVGVMDVGFCGLGYPQFTKACWHKTPTLAKYVAAHSCPPQTTAGRLYDTAIYKNQCWLQGHRLINGYAGMYPIQRLDYEHINTLRAAEVAWFRDYIFGAGIAPRRPNGLGPPQYVGWCAVPDPLPRARLVGRVVASDDPREDIKRIDVDTTALVARDIQLPPSQPGTAKLTVDRPGRIAVETAAPDRQLLTVSESFHPGWRAYLDDRPARIEQVNGDFIGCIVPEGAHCVRFEFAPRSVFVGKIISLAGVALTCLVVGAAFCRGQPPSSRQWNKPW